MILLILKVMIRMAFITPTLPMPVAGAVIGAMLIQKIAWTYHLVLILMDLTVNLRVMLSGG